MLLLFGDFFPKSSFEKLFSNTILVLNTLDQDQARHFFGQTLVQTVCKSYQQMTIGDKEISNTKCG